MTSDQAISLVIQVEGGYVNDPADPGGETKFGISKRAFPDLDIRELQETDARRIYLEQYWNPNRCGEMPHGLDLLFFDSCVNQGPRAATLILERTLLRALRRPAQGVISDEVLAAAVSQDRLELMDLFCAERAVWYIGSQRIGVYARGWMRRLFRVHREAATSLAL